MVIVNRLLPNEISDAWFNEWHTSQDKILHEIEEYFAPVPVKRVPLFAHEVLGRQRLEELAGVLVSCRGRSVGGNADRKALHLRETERSVRSSGAAAVCHQR